MDDLELAILDLLGGHGEQSLRDLIGRLKGRRLEPTPAEGAAALERLKDLGHVEGWCGLHEWRFSLTEAGRLAWVDRYVESFWSNRGPARVPVPPPSPMMGCCSDWVS